MNSTRSILRRKKTSLSRRILAPVTGLALLLLGFAVSAETIRFDGAVDAAHPLFEKKVTNALYFVVAKNRDDWNIAITDVPFSAAGAGAVQKYNFIQMLTPPLHGAQATVFSPGYYGRRAYDQIYDRSFCFLADPASYQEAHDAYDALQSGAGKEQKALDELAALKTGWGGFRILDAEIANENYKHFKTRQNDMKLPITGMRFQVTLKIPAAHDAMDCL